MSTTELSTSATGIPVPTDVSPTSKKPKGKKSKDEKKKKQQERDACAEKEKEKEKSTTTDEPDTKRIKLNSDDIVVNVAAAALSSVTSTSADLDAPAGASNSHASSAFTPSSSSPESAALSASGSAAGSGSGSSSSSSSSEQEDVEMGGDSKGSGKAVRPEDISWAANEPVEVFFRFCQEKGPGFFPVETEVQGQFHPCIAKTDGWLPAIIESPFSGKNFDRKNKDSYVKIKYVNPLWFNRLGEPWKEGRFRTDRVAPELVRRCRKSTEAPYPRPKASFFVVRWGGKKKVDPVTEGVGGWGQVGSNPSDNFINTLFNDAPMDVFGPNYEVISAFVQSSYELKEIFAPFVRQRMRGEFCCGMYFLWPIGFQDGHDFAGYVKRDDLYSLMCQMEATGVITRFPHHSHLYRTLASKEWCSSMCMIPNLKCPLTTKVTRSMIIQHGYKNAAMVILDALNCLNQARNALFSGNQVKKNKITKGVAKLGYSWEAMDVNHWSSPQTLATSLEEIIQQPGNLMEYCIVQEWVDIDVEMRHFVVLPKNGDDIKIEKIVYTCYESKAEGHFSSFNKFGREDAVKKTFEGDDACLKDCEAQAAELIKDVFVYLRGECCEMPPILRFDVLAHRTGPGKASVQIGEITELGACFLGWPEGPEVVFDAMCKSIQGSDTRGYWSHLQKKMVKGPGNKSK